MSQTQMIHVDVDDVRPYEFNPRKNAEAVLAVKASIRDFGFLIPIVLDENYEIVSGHTRHKAIQELIVEEPEKADIYRSIPAVVASDLTEEQVRAFRLIDNKTSEIATWDFDLLSKEITALHESGIPLTEFGWTQEEVDCLTAVVDDDCLSSGLGDGAGTGETFNPGGGRMGTHATTRDGASVRITFGELAFFVGVGDYKEWLDARMAENEYDPRAVIEDIAEKMGLLGAKLRRDQAVIDGKAAPESEEAFDSAGVAPVPEQS